MATGLVLGVTTGGVANLNRTFFVLARFSQ